MEENKKTYKVWDIEKAADVETSTIKPKLTIPQQIVHLEAKGVTFKRCSKEEAAQKLQDTNSYLHITSYRILFQKHTHGKLKGKYVNLDFADLLDLNELDNELRTTLLLIAQDIERIAKTRLLNKIDINENEDGYSIVGEFMLSLGTTYCNNLNKTLLARCISKTPSNIYSGKLIEHYKRAIPAWVFLEVVPFGTMLSFYLFCSERWGVNGLRDEHYILNYVKAVRNCCAHGNCLINGFTNDFNTTYKTPGAILKWLNVHGITNSKSRQNKLRNSVMQQIICTIALFDILDSNHLCESSRAVLVKFNDSIKNSLPHYGAENSFMSYLDFLSKAIDLLD